MGEEDDIEAEARALVAKREREREIVRRADEIDRDAAMKAREAQRATRPLWLKAGGAVLAACAVTGAIIVMGAGAKEQREQEQADTGDCDRLAARAIQLAAELATRVCGCDSTDCVRRAIEGSRHATILVERERVEDFACPEGLELHQQRAVDEHLARGQVCIDDWLGR